MSRLSPTIGGKEAACEKRALRLLRLRKSSRTCKSAETDTILTNVIYLRTIYERMSSLWKRSNEPIFHIWFLPIRLETENKDVARENVILSTSFCEDINFILFKFRDSSPYWATIRKDK